MDIAAMSIGLSQARVQQQSSLSVMKLAMESSKVQAEMVTELAAVLGKSIEQSVQPHIGRSIDMRL